MVGGWRVEGGGWWVGGGGWLKIERVKRFGEECGRVV